MPALSGANACPRGLPNTQGNGFAAAAAIASAGGLYSARGFGTGFGAGSTALPGLPGAAPGVGRLGCGLGKFSAACRAAGSPEDSAPSGLQESEAAVAAAGARLGFGLGRAGAAGSAAGGPAAQVPLG